MCGIWAYIELIKNTTDYKKLFQDFMNLKPRGPDMSNFQIINNLTVGFHRLAIMDPAFHANQPYILEDDLKSRTIIFVCNGEIYNFKELISEHKLPIYNNSDCMTIPQLYLHYVKYNKIGKNNITDFVELFKYNIKGEFAFILFEFDEFQNLKEIISGRDMIGIRPLYMGVSNQSIMFSSELKGMHSFDDDSLLESSTFQVNEFKPGYINQIYFDSSLGINKINICNFNDYSFRTVYDIVPYDLSQNTHINKEQLEKSFLLDIRESVINSVKRRLTADRPLAFLLSGGLDSSLTASISAKILDKPINTYCCGLIGTDSTDIKYARLAAEHINSNHTEVMVTIEEALSMIETVIKVIETYCVTSIRASIPQYLVSKYIGDNTDAKVIITGEASDEVTSGYLYNYYAPSPNALHEGAKEYVNNIHMYDGRRCDRCVSAASCEARIPLADPEFIKAYWSTPSEWRMPTYKNCEKWLLRKSFDETDIVQQDVLWRRKEAFSDGISGVTTKSWYQIIQDHIDTIVSNEEFANYNKQSFSSSNLTKEEYYYKKIFVKHFGAKRLNIIPGHWQPKWDSNGNVIKDYVDPSARTLDIYKK
jgi:asparagine synthase (glutamine-hydrolysing)